MTCNEGCSWLKQMFCFIACKEESERLDKIDSELDVLERNKGKDDK